MKNPSEVLVKKAYSTAVPVKIEGVPSTSIFTRFANGVQLDPSPNMRLGNCWFCLYGNICDHTIKNYGVSADIPGVPPCRAKGEAKCSTAPEQETMVIHT